MKTPCPICKKQATARDDPAHPNKYFPFCGERCQLIDLGRWLDGKYQIPVESDNLDEGFPNEPPPSDRDGLE
jgi:endogenous inhibitor of DNA gyrase (YacG/DUF329 family)